MSDRAGTVVNGPESRHVADAVEALLDRDADGARRRLVEGARTTSWAAIVHRLDVAGRALAQDARLDPDDAPSWATHVAVLAGAAHVDAVPSGLVEVLAAWSRGDGIPVAVDLSTGQIDARSELTRAWTGTIVLAWLVDRSGFPPQVVA